MSEKGLTAAGRAPAQNGELSHVIGTGAALLAAGIGIIVQFGWANDITALTQILPGLTAMNPVAAVSLTIASLLMVFHSGADRRITWILSALVSLVGLLKLLELSGFSGLAIDQLLFADKLDDALGVPPNRMAPNTALALVLTGIAISAGNSNSRWAIRLSQVLACTVIAITLFAIIGYTLGIVSLYGVKAFTPMAIHTACALLLISVAVMAANPRAGIMRILGDRGPAGQLSRLILPAVVIVPIVVGMLRLKGQELGYFDTATGVALQVFGNVIVTFTLLMVSIFYLYQADILRRSRELSVRRSEEEYRLAEELGHVGHWRLDKNSSQPECSEELHRICGMEDGTFLSQKDLSALFQPEDASLEQDCIVTALRDGTGWDGTRRLIRPDGETRTIRSHGEVERDESGDIVGVFGVFVDITQLELSRRAAEAATAAKADFLANMSHEIRTPLNSIIGFTDLILDDGALAHAHRRQLGLVRTAGRALLTVVNDILDFSKIEAGKVELVARPFDLVHLAQGAISIVHQSAQTKGLTVEFEANSELHQFVIGDDGRIRQILLNLLSNAIKFTEEGTVSLRIEGDNGSNNPDRVKFAVADTGVGVPPDQEDRLFHKFSQANSSISRDYGGTGLGLAISKKLVELMGGEIGFVPRREGGTEFWFTVPLEATDAHSIDKKIKVPAGKQSQRILVVEDVEANQELAMAMLTRVGHDVEIASNGREAVAAVQKHDFDLILMDVQMPVMDGVTATKLIRLLPGKARNIPIIGLTANILPEQVATFRSAGMNGHVGKPINAIELMDAIDVTMAKNSTEMTGKSAAAGSARVDWDEAIYRDLEALLPANRFTIHLSSFRSSLETFLTPKGSEALRKDAVHKMVSQAGMFGFNRLSEVCRELQDALEYNQPIEHLMLRIQTATEFARCRVDDMEHVILRAHA